MVSVNDQLHRKKYAGDAVAPLQGVRVLDMSRLVAGNMVTHVLADFGAEVVKIEDPARHDDLRNWRVEGIPTFWKVYARNKKSITLDCRSDEGRAILGKLVGTAHVLVENFLPGKLEAYGFGPDWLHGINEKLIIVRVSGWGQDGPFRHKPGFGSLVEAMSGFAAMNGFPDREPLLPPLAMADMIAGLSGAAATLVAVREIEVNGGRGQTIDVSLFEPMLSILGPQAANCLLTGKAPERLGSRSSIASPRNVYRCKDGRYVSLSASTQTMAEKLFASIGRPDLISDPRFATNADRVRNDEELDSIVGDFMRSRTRDDVLEHFDNAGVTVGMVADAGELLAHPFVVERESLVAFPDEEMGELPMHNVTPRLSGSPGSIRSPAPRVGQHTLEVLSEVGVDSDAVAVLRRKGIV
jgi:formyl-CoA transferase